MCGTGGACRAVALAIVAILAAPVCYEWFPPEVHEVRGKCVVVAGASTGLGVDIAVRLAGEGVAKMILTARSEAKLEGVARDISRRYPGTQVYAVRSDISVDQDQVELVRVTRDRFGDTCQVILVNNAAVISSQHFERAPLGQIDAMLDINVKGLIHLTRAFLPFLLEAGGHVVNIGSLAGKIVLNNAAVYGASKHAVAGFTSGLRAEMRYKRLPVTVHGVMPGFVVGTGMAHENSVQNNLPLSRVTNGLGSSEGIDVANAVVTAVKYDYPEMLVNSRPLRPLVVLSAMFPRFLDFAYQLPLPSLQDAWRWQQDSADISA